MKIGFISLGCPKNLVDGEVMLGIAQQAGHEITPAAKDADVLRVVSWICGLEHLREAIPYPRMLYRLYP